MRQENNQRCDLTDGSRLFGTAPRQLGNDHQRGATLTDWNEHLETANGRVAEIEDKIAAQNEALQRLSGEGADIHIVTRMLEVLKQSLERANIHKRFIETRIERVPASARRG
jgi:hypothetical protein